MDKYEYKVRSEEISKLIDKEKYAEAVKIADTIDWRRVKSASMLLKIAALYRISRRNEDSREMLMLAYERYPTNRSVVYSLCELSIELDDVVAAIEYYKQFAKLAPKDNGVYTLRYRILEAQEASLEERIEILEELKKKDYQEEWAYELAYLYHRVGLSTKCVEECDDIILWFGDGPYVMKAMELKAKHVPLTDIQQQNYNIMLGNAGQNYSSNNYDTSDYNEESYAGGQEYNDESYAEQGYAGGQEYNNESYAERGYADGQGYNTESYAEQGYADGQGYNGEGYAEQGYDTGNYAEQGYDTGNYAEQGYEAGNYATQGYEAVNYNGQAYGEDSYDTYGNGYEQGSYAGGSYGNDYGQENYPDEQYSDGDYSRQDYPGGQYVEEGYDQGNYPGGQYTEDGYGQYADDSYAPNNYVDDGYGNLSYVDGSYQDNGYTSEFYVEQMYDENGNLINPETYAQNDHPQTEAAQDNGYAGQTEAPKEYRNGLHLVENTAAPAGNPGDMSQYNTINLQKVVAESMKELFPDDNDDVFAEDREKYNSGVDMGTSNGDTRIFAGVSDIAKSKPDESAGSQTTGRVNIAQMVTGVSEKEPEPHTGAIKKVLVPGDDARAIKSDSSIEELRDTTEKSVDDEHNRMEDNDENVYHEQSIIDTNETDETLQAQVTGPMKLDEVLVEWERMKQDNAKKHQEEIKKRVLTQTGKIFADFDNSIKSGILGELEREEEEAQRSDAAANTSKRENHGSQGSDGFLDADVTGNIPQQPVSEDDFDVEYVADHKNPVLSQEPQESEEAIRSPESDQLKKNESDVKEENPSVPDDIVLQEPDARPEGSVDETHTEKAVGYQAGEYTQKIPEESVSVYEADAYTQEIYGEEASERGIEPYTQKISTEGVESSDIETASYVEESSEATAEEYIEETYTEDADGYTGKVYAEAADEYDGETYTEETYIEEKDGYTEEAYAENADEYMEQAYSMEQTYSTEQAYSMEPVYSMEEAYSGGAGAYTEELLTEGAGMSYPEGNVYDQEDLGGYAEETYIEDAYDDLEDAYSESADDTRYIDHRRKYQQNYQYNEKDLDPEDAESIAEMAKEDALKTQEIKMNTADLSSLSEKIVATTKKEASGAKREEIRDFTPEEQTLFENFAVTKKIKKQIIFALENMTLAAYTGNVIITGDAGLDTVRMAKNLIKEYQASDEGFSGKLAKITGEKINQRNIKDVFEKLNNGGIIIEKANGMSEEKLYELAINLNQDAIGIVVIMEDTKKEITKLLEKQAMIMDYFNIRIDLMEMDNNALVAYAKNYALALEYSIDELGTLALYTRIANMQSGNHVVTKDEVRDIIDEAIWKSKKSKIKNFVDVLFARRYDNEDMIVLKERDFM